MSEKLPDQPLIEHITALREALLRTVFAILIAYVPAFLVTPWMLDALAKYACPENMRSFAYFAPMEVLIIQLKTAFVIAFVAVFPYVVYQFWRFLAPALYQNERNAVKLWVFTATVLFVTGATFCIFVIVPVMMNFSQSFATETIKPVIGFANFIDMTLRMMLAFGLMFQFPIIVISAIRMGITDVKSVAAKRPYFIVGILVLSAIFTPPDIISQILLGLPCWILFEAALIGAKFMKNKQENHHEKDDNNDGVEYRENTNKNPDSVEANDGAMLDFYERESERK